MKSKGTVDLLHGSIFKSLIGFMWPIFLSQAFQQLYNAVDTAIVGNVLGETSLAAVGAGSSIFDLMVGFSVSLGSGLGIVAARAYGSGREKMLKKSAAGAVLITAVTALVFTVLSVFLLRPLLALLHTPDEILEESLSYIRIIGLYISVMFAYNLASAMLRSIGNSFMPLIFLIISSLLNIFLDYAFMAWCGMGVAGAAIATVIAQAVSTVLSFLYIFRKTKMLVPSREDFRIGKDLFSELFAQGYAMAFMGSIVSIGSVILQSGINGLGTHLIAAHVAARKIFSLMDLPFFAMANAVATFISQNKGADQGERIVKAMKDAWIYDFVIAGVVAVFLWTCAPSLIHLISGSTNPLIIDNGSRYLYTCAPFYAVLGVLLDTRMGLQALGSKAIPLISSFIECGGKILFTFAFIPRFGYGAVIWCEPLIWCVMTVQLLYSWYHNSYMKKVRDELKTANVS